MGTVSRSVSGAAYLVMISFGVMALVPYSVAGINDGEGGSMLSSPGNYALTCWQHGIKIVDRRNLADLKGNPSVGQRPIQFVDRSKEGLAVQIYDLGETLCMVQGEP